MHVLGHFAPQTMGGIEYNRAREQSLVQDSKGRSAAVSQCMCNKARAPARGTDVHTIGVRNGQRVAAGSSYPRKCVEGLEFRQMSENPFRSVASTSPQENQPPIQFCRCGRLNQQFPCLLNFFPERLFTLHVAGDLVVRGIISSASLFHFLSTNPNFHSSDAAGIPHLRPSLRI